MRKIITFILLIFYVSSSSGITIHMHYCMGELAGWGLWDHKSTTCHKCGMDEKASLDTGCCKDVRKEIKLDKEQKISESSLRMVQLLPAVLSVPFSEISFNDIPSVTEENPLGHGPPRSSGIAVYLRHCVFLI